MVSSRAAIPRPSLGCRVALRIERDGRDRPGPGEPRLEYRGLCVGPLPEQEAAQPPAELASLSPSQYAGSNCRPTLSAIRADTDEVRACDGACNGGVSEWSRSSPGTAREVRAARVVDGRRRGSRRTLFHMGIV